MSDLFVDNIKHQSSQGSGTITLGASGETIALASGAQVSGFTGQNYPAFEAKLSGDQTLTVDAEQLITFNAENLDTDSSFNTGTYTFQPTVAGKYFVYAQARFTHGGDDLGLIYIYLADQTDTVIALSQSEDRLAGYVEIRTLNFSKIVDMNGSTSTLRVGAFAEQLGAGAITVRSSGTLFGAFRIGA
jgi:hypothetical protein